MLTLKLLRAGYPRTPTARLQLFLPALKEATSLAEADTIPRLAAFLAQIGHESGRLVYVSELWGPTAQQARYERNFNYPWSAKRGAVNRLAYNLGNVAAGDGSRYRGHGLIQVTGRANHRTCTANLRTLLGAAVPDFEAEPKLLTNPRWAALSAAEYWRRKRLNDFADSRDLAGMTKVINGGYNGLADRATINTAFTTALILGNF
jgi:putative chitinase